MIKNKSDKKLSVETYIHGDKKRINNPPVGLVSSSTDTISISKTKYEHDPHIDPYLSWAGKKEGSQFEVPNLSLHVHERIDPKQLVMAFMKKKSRDVQPSFWEDPFKDLPLLKDVQFYQHEHGWANRLIAGDSQLVMNSLLQKEGMAGKVQMVYIDPPYGIKYNSNFQPFVNKKNVRDNNDDDISGEPETIKAFRDTWELEIHSYLTYLRDRLLLAYTLLNDSGSCFVQINVANLQYVKLIMQEIFGVKNFVNIIAFKKKSSPQERNGLCEMFDYIVWFAKDIKQMKYKNLYKPRRRDENLKGEFKYLEENGIVRKIEDKDINDINLDLSKVFRTHSAISKRGKLENIFPIEVEGKKIIPPTGNEWESDEDGMKRLITTNRLYGSNPSRMYKIYFTDFPYNLVTNIWIDTLAEQQAIYAVQTDELPVQRCILMTTDPGDIVIDPTCGSGTTAFVAEELGRRWITCDTSRVALTLAKQRLMTAFFNYYVLAHPEEGIRSGFTYKKVKHINLKSIAEEQDPEEEILYNEPIIDRTKIRVTGPFTVEAVPSLRIKPFDNTDPQSILFGDMFARTGATAQYTEWIDELKATGIRATKNEMISFTRIEPLSGTKYLHAEAQLIKDSSTQKAVISFGPNYGPLEQRQVEQAINEAKSLKEPPSLIIFTAFHFDPEAAKDIDQINQSIGQFIPGANVLKVQMSVDLLTKDLRKKRSSNQSYWLIGQPDIELKRQTDGTYIVKVNGFDYYNPISGEIDSGSINRIAMWMLDTDYDERSIFPSQVFFPISDVKRGWNRLAKALNGEVNQDLLEAFTGIQSLPFVQGENKKIAVKIIDDRGIESFVVKSL